MKRRPAETLGEYAVRLEADGRWRKGRDPTAGLSGATALLERAAYGDQEPDAATRGFVEQVVRSLSPAPRSQEANKARDLKTP